MNLIAFSGPGNCVNTQYAALSGAMELRLTLPTPYFTERLLMGCKESNQTKQTKHHLM